MRNMTIKEEILNQIKKRLGAEHVYEKEPMWKHTSMEVGGPAAYLFMPGNMEEAVFLLQALKLANYPYYIKGNGSNLIVRDEGYDGAFIEMMRMNRITVKGNRVTAECGAMLKDISRVSLEASLSGFEFASGIPGSLGGAITMNAGAYDGEMKDIVKTVTLIDREGNLLTRTGEEMDFSYRHSICSKGLSDTERRAAAGCGIRIRSALRLTICQPKEEKNNRLIIRAAGPHLRDRKAILPDS